MLFNSLDFAIFLPIVFIIYWFVLGKNYKHQNLFLIAASFVFYGWWDWRFLFLLIFSAGIDFFAGIMISRSESAARKKLFLLLSIGTNLGILGFFKYFNFFIENFVDAFSLFGLHFNPVTLRIILPVGVSFYTFQALSYTIEVYRGKLIPTKNPVEYYAFISFFPQLLAGPIERATNLLQQFYGSRRFDYDMAVDGLRQILWGLFKKMIIADSCAILVNEIFSNYQTHSGIDLVLGAVFFAFQIYGDFSGYSDIAIGTAKLFGFKIMRNFAYPYFSRDIAEFWRRWHISLSSWFRDYIYIPLGGCRVTKLKHIRNIFIIYLVSGFWHGANWTFIAWGFINAILFLPLVLARRNRKNLDIVAEGRIFPSLLEAVQIVFTFSCTTLAWIFFRSPNIKDACLYIKGIFSRSLFTLPHVGENMVIIILIFLLIEWVSRTKQHALIFKKSFPSSIKWALYVVMVIIILTYSGANQEFIYFQF